MEAFVWDERYLTGEAPVDDEHHELVRLINSLAQIAGHAQPGTIEPVLNQLSSYAAEHFAHEEALMSEWGCDPRHVQKHCAAHEAFCLQIDKMHAADAGSIDIELLFRFLSRWLSGHILGIDLAMARQIAAIRAGRSAVEAYDQDRDDLSGNSSGILLEALASMHITLAARNAELAKLNQVLEQQVEQRTRALSEANRQLQADQLELRRRLGEIEALNTRLTVAQAQLFQSEKLASIGQLAAGVAHEINNPIGFVHSNLGALENYWHDLLRLIAAYEEVEPSLPDPGQQATLQTLRRQIDLDLLKKDLPVLLRESREGTGRVRQIVQDLTEFSCVDGDQGWQFSDLHHNIDATLAIVAGKIADKAEVIREYGELPRVECLPAQLNQVFMGLMLNAADAMGAAHGRIVIRSACIDDEVWIEFADNGCGMSADVRRHVFEPFFTTKAVGKGTGLGLSLSHGIVRRHRGSIEVDSEPGKGSCFRIRLPVRQNRQDKVPGEAP